MKMSKHPLTALHSTIASSLDSTIQFISAAKPAEQ
jgi:hypothetical protein